jgi:chorismate mutase/prephenate dehydratase
MGIEEYRTQINAIDDQMVKLLVERMNKSAEIAAYKRENHLPVSDKTREREVLNRAADQVDGDMANYVKVFFSTLFDLSKSYQTRVIAPTGELAAAIQASLADTPKQFPQRAVVACQGVEGAYSQMACDKLFALPNILYFRHFEGVLQAVQSGMCQYGILPIENSSYGSVTQVYDLMRQYQFSIARSIKLLISHSLLAKPGTRMEEIKEIFSHDQAIGQCSEFLRKNPEIKVTVCENTAIAAKMVAVSDRRDVAAISSKDCADLYDLTILNNNIQNNAFNYTRFICISKKMEIYPGADKISIITTVSHKPGSLHELLAKFSTLGVNLSKLESRPIPGKDFEFMFYFDFDASVYSADVIHLLSDLEAGNETFVFLGSYSEV